jgi:glycosyltransferase involved in cell wall biosynthesis
MLRVPDGRLVALPGGVDTRQFAPRTVERADFWPRVLADHPRGWLPDERPGSARYGREEAAGLARRVVLLYVGRFTAVKRLDLLLAAFAAAQDRARTPTALVLVGGHPGEWQGEHPAEIAARLGVPNVFLAGWYAHDELADFFAAADAVVLASDREQFGQVLLEAMACGLPAITTRSLGPASIIEDGRTGWLASPGDAAALAQAIAQAVDDAAERSLRGRVARHVVCERFAWSTVTDKLLAVMTEVAEARGPGEERRGREDLRGGRRLSR